MSVRFAVEAWAPEYGSPLGIEQLEPADVSIDASVEAAPGEWAPITPVADAASPVRFVDGVRRIDAWVWITDADGVTRPGIAASYAAGVVCCDGEASIEAAEVRRGLFSAAASMEPISTRHGTYEPHAVAGDAIERLSQDVQQHLGRLEALVATEAGGGIAAGLLVVDGPLSRLPALRHAVGYIKTHHKAYLSGDLARVVDALAPGQRTPLFITTSGWSRYSWYLRLPSNGAQGSPGTSGGTWDPPGPPWSGVVRCEASGDLSPADAKRTADTAAATLPRFAAGAYKDPRAPQNLYPIAGLERTLRRRLGDPSLIYRSLRAAVPA